MDITFNTALLNLVAFLVFVICVTIYSIKLKLGMKKPATAKRGLLNIFYSRWVERMNNPDETIIAVQTLRNLIMSVTFLSSTMLILLGLLVDTGIGIDEVVGGSFVTIPIVEYKMIVLFAVVVFSLFSFLLSLRQLVRFTILVGIPNAEIVKTGDKELESNNTCTLDSKALQSEVFIKAMNRFAYGMRGVFYAITVLIWFISSYAFIASSIILTIYLISYQDIKTPCVEETPI